MKIIVGTVIKQDGKYLLVQEKRERCYGKWNLPAGHLDKGESIFAGAIRETKEETGFDVKLDGLVTIDHFTASELPNSPGAMAIIFTATIESGEIKFPPEEILDVQWFTFDELKNLDLRAGFIMDSIEKVEKGISYPLEVIKEVKQ